jgi:aminopeptidase-like protein
MTNLSRFNRSLTGDGVRSTLSVLKEYLPDLKIHEAISGSKVYDWQIPAEWNVREAYLIGPDGNTIFDINRGDTILHVIGYSESVDIIGLALEDLRSHVVVGQEDLPDSVPYTTAYYAPRTSTR